MTNLKKTTLQFLILFFVCQACKAPTPKFNARHYKLEQRQGGLAERHFARKELHVLYSIWTKIIKNGVPEGDINPYAAFCSLRLLGREEMELTGRKARHDKLAEDFQHFFVFPFESSIFQEACKDYGVGEIF